MARAVAGAIEAKPNLGQIQAIKAHMGADRDRMPGETGGASGPDRDPGEGDRCIRTLPPAHTRASVSRTGEMRTRGRDAFGTSAAVMPRRDGRRCRPPGAL